MRKTKAFRGIKHKCKCPECLSYGQESLRKKARAEAKAVSIELKENPELMK